MSLPKTLYAAPQADLSGRATQSGPSELGRQDVAMWWIALLLALINDLVADRNRLALKNAALRHQVAVLKRSVKRAKINDSDRVFWILIRRLLANSKEQATIRMSPLFGFS